MIRLHTLQNYYVSYFIDNAEVNKYLKNILNMVKPFSTLITVPKTALFHGEREKRYMHLKSDIFRTFELTSQPSMKRFMDTN